MAIPGIVLRPLVTTAASGSDGVFKATIASKGTVTEDGATKQVDTETRIEQLSMDVSMWLKE
jgi:hypothetical protein